MDVNISNMSNNKISIILKFSFSLHEIVAIRNNTRNFIVKALEVNLNSDYNYSRTHWLKQNSTRYILLWFVLLLIKRAK